MNQNPNAVSDIQMPFISRFPVQLSVPLLLSSPHSGRFYPQDFLQLSQHNSNILQNFEDAFVDEIFSFAPQHKISLICANYARSYLDLNRAPDALDSLLFRNYINRKPCINTQNGYGIIPRLIAPNIAIYKQKLEIAEGYKRIEILFKPYHQAIKNELLRIKDRFGVAILLDCHSMPSKALGPSKAIGKEDIDIIIGDRFGSSISPLLCDKLMAELGKEGFRLRKNHIYSGGYITQNYGKPNDNIHAVQIEINRKLYMPEDQYAKSPDFANLCQRLENAISKFSQDL